MSILTMIQLSSLQSTPSTESDASLKEPEVFKACLTEAIGAIEAKNLSAPSLVKEEDLINSKDLSTDKEKEDEGLMESLNYLIPLKILSSEIIEGSPLQGETIDSALLGADSLGTNKSISTEALELLNMTSEKPNDVDPLQLFQRAFTGGEPLTSDEWAQLESVWNSATSEFATVSSDASLRASSAKRGVLNPTELESTLRSADDFSFSLSDEWYRIQSVQRNVLNEELNLNDSNLGLDSIDGKGILEHKETLLEPSSLGTSVQKSEQLSDSSFLGGEIDYSNMRLNGNAMSNLSSNVEWNNGETSSVTSHELNWDNRDETLHVIMDKATTLIEGETTSLRLNLKPKELGELQLELSLKNGELRGKILVEQAEIQTLVEQALRTVHEQSAPSSYSFQHVEVEVQNQMGSNNQPQHEEKESQESFSSQATIKSSSPSSTPKHSPISYLSRQTGLNLIV